MPNRQDKVFININNADRFNSLGEPLGNRTFPQITSGEQVDYACQFVESFTSPEVFTPVTQFTGQSITASAVIDDDFTHYIDGILVDATLTGAITSIEISGLAEAPIELGFILLTNGSLESESVEYTAVSKNGLNYIFTVNTTLTYSYVAGDTANMSDPALVKSTVVDQTNKDTGLFIITMNANTLPYLRAVRNIKEIKNCQFEFIARNDQAQPTFIQSFDILCFNTRDNDGVIPPPANGDYYTIIESDAVYVPRAFSSMSIGSVVSLTDKAVLDQGGGAVTVTVQELADAISLGAQTPPVHEVYVDEATMLADQLVLPQIEDYFYQVGNNKDATIYKKKASSTGDLDTDYIDVTGRPLHKKYDNNALMFADQAVQKEDFFYRVGIADPYTFYEYLGTTVGDITDYVQVGDSGGTSVPPVDGNYANTTAMFADQGNQTADYFYEINEVYYQYLGTTTGDLTDYKFNTDQTLKKADSVEFADITLGSANVKYNADFDMVEYSTGAGDFIKVGLDSAFVFYNDTGAEIPAGRVLHLVAVSTASGHILPTFELADASTHEKCQGTLIFTCCAIPIASVGLGLTKGQADGVDTTGFSAPAQVWLSDNGTGIPTTTKPKFPNFSISVGGVANAQADGTFVINFTTSITDIYNDAWDGTFVESFNFLITSDGATIKGTLSNTNPARNLTANFSSGFATIDTTTTPNEITLTAGTDSNMQDVWVYMPEDTKVLTESLTGFPTGEYIAVIDGSLKTAVTTQSNGGAFVNRNWNDHIKDEANNGHIPHMTKRMRREDAKHISGTEGAVTVSASLIDVAITGGVVSQIHDQTFQAFDTSVGDVLTVTNDFTTAYLQTADLETITTDASGNSLTNTSYTVVIWGVQNKTGEYCPVMVNMPTGTYSKNTPDDAVTDASKFTVYDFPERFVGKGFLVRKATFVNNNGTITKYADSSLTGQTPNTASGGGGGGGGGVTTYLGLTDTDNSYTGQKGLAPQVNETETALEFVKVGTTPQSTLNAVSNGSALTADTVTNYLALDGTVTIPDSPPSNGVKYFITTWSAGTASGAVGRIEGATSGDAIVPTFGDNDGVLCLEGDGFTGTYKVVR